MFRRRGFYKIYMREIKTIKLGELEIDIITALTWGEASEIQAVLYEAAQVGGIKPGAEAKDVEVNLGLGKSMIDAKYKMAEVCIKEIRQGDQKIPYTKDWLYGLEVDTGNELMEELDNVGKKK